MFRYRQNGGSIGKAATVSNTTASGVFDITTAAVNVAKNNWAGTVPDLIPSFADDIAGFAVHCTNSGQNYTVRMQFYNLTNDGMYYQLRTDLGTPDYNSSGVGTNHISSSLDGKYIVYSGASNAPTNNVFTVFRRDEFQMRYKYSFRIQSNRNTNGGTVYAHINPSGNLLVVGDQSTGVRVFYLSGDSYTELPSIPGNPGTDGYYGVIPQWNWDGSRLAVVCNSKLYLWNVSGNTFSLISSSLTATGFIAWKRDNSALITLSGHYYVFSSNVADPPTLAASVGKLTRPSDTTYSLSNESWNRHGNLLITGTSFQNPSDYPPYLYYVSGNTFTSINAAAVSTSKQCFFSGTSDFLIGFNSTNTIVIDTYSVSGNTITKHANVRCGTNFQPDIYSAFGVIHKSG